MARLPFMMTLAVTALLASSASNPAGADPYNPGASGGKYQYGPYRAQDNPDSGSQAAPEDDNADGPADDRDDGANAGQPPEDQSAGPPPVDRNGGPSYRDDSRRDSDPDADDGDDRAEAPPGDTYSPPPRDGQEPPPREVVGPPPRDFDSNLPRVEVRASAPDGSVPYAIREHDARRAAIEAWRSKVVDRFGPEFSHWRMAAGKHVDCMPDRRDGLVCVASAQPVRGFDRYGQWHRDRRY